MAADARLPPAKPPVDAPHRPPRVLILNVGSGTFKWSLFAAGAGEDGASGAVAWAAAGLDERGAQVREQLRRLPAFDAVGHRIVHGGPLFHDSVPIDDAVRARLEELAPLDPLHMIPALAAVDAVRALFPRLPQVAAFDTAFHATLPPAAACDALPYEWTERYGLRRFGFHGLSVEYAVARAAELLGAAPRRLVVAHLGSGCSVTAVDHGRSVDTTMGFSVLDGIMMGTRSGAVDPGLLLHLQLRHGMRADELLDAVSHRSGLLGLSGVSADLREVLAAADRGHARARLAYERFILDLRRAIGAAAGVLGALDALVYTGAIGEHSARVRQDTAPALAGHGAALDAAANDARSGDRDIAASASRVRMLVVQSREDRVILQHVRRRLAATP